MKCALIQPRSYAYPQLLSAQPEGHALALVLFLWLLAHALSLVPQLFSQLIAGILAICALNLQFPLTHFKFGTYIHEICVCVSETEMSIEKAKMMVDSIATECSRSLSQNIRVTLGLTPTLSRCKISETPMYCMPTVPDGQVNRF